VRSKLRVFLSTFALGLVGLDILNAHATIIETSEMTLVATVDTLGTYDNAGLEYYNGQTATAN
jgi:hypothetical protein